VAKESAAVCIRLPPAGGEDAPDVAPAGSDRDGPAITELAWELKTPGVQMVSMESASGHWRIWFIVLEEAGLAVQLVNSSRARSLPGRPKTGKEDARWIARLTEMGLLRPSFVPPPEIRALRLLTRHISDLTADRTRYWQRLGKLLEDGLCKLTSVVSELAGHQTARAVIEAMISGERDPRALAALGKGNMRDEKLPGRLRRREHEHVPRRALPPHGVPPAAGGRKAGCAAGRSILVIVWHLLSDRASRHCDLGPDWHARHTDRNRKARSARRQLEALGYEVIITLREDAA
jgi:Transposase